MSDKEEVFETSDVVSNDAPIWKLRYEVDCGVTPDGTRRWSVHETSIIDSFDQLLRSLHHYTLHPDTRNVAVWKGTVEWYDTIEKW